MPTATTWSPQPEVIDSCSIKASPVRGPRGFDGAKKIDGIKRHIVVDTLGLLVAVLVTAASVQDRAALPRLLGRAPSRCPRLGHLWADQGSTGSVVQAVSRILRFTLQIVGGIKPKGGFITQPRRWVVERTFAWMHRCRRLTRQYSRPIGP